METLSKGKTYEEHLACASDPKNFSDMSRPGGTIDRDLRRTFPTVRFFLFLSLPLSLILHTHSLSVTHTHTHTFKAILLKDSKGRRALRNILVAYHNYDRDLQYTQGMNFFSAMFLSYMPESDGTLIFRRKIHPFTHLPTYTHVHSILDACCSHGTTVRSFRSLAYR
jgi:hypothetical protein